MKKLFIVSLAIAFALVSVAPALATDDANNAASTSSVQDKVKEAKAKLAKKFVPRAVTFSGKLTNISGTAAPTELTVKVSSAWPKKMKKWTGTHPEATKDFIVKITDKSRIVRAYWAKSSLSEMAIGDVVKVTAKYNKDGSWTAQVVRDMSLHVLLNKKGVVESIDTANSTFTMKQDNRVLTVKVSDKTKFVMKGSTTTTFVDLKVGDKITLRGIVNLTLKTVDASSVVINKRPVPAPVPAVTIPAEPATAVTPTNS